MNNLSLPPSDTDKTFILNQIILALDESLETASEYFKLGLEFKFKASPVNMDTALTEYEDPNGLIEVNYLIDEDVSSYPYNQRYLCWFDEFNDKLSAFIKRKSPECFPFFDNEKWQTWADGVVIIVFPY
jgi:hypothetical protein